MSRLREVEISADLSDYPSSELVELAKDALDASQEAEFGLRGQITGLAFTIECAAELIQRRLHQVVQPDVCWCGGMTELVKIYRLAREHGVRVCPHRGGEIWALCERDVPAHLPERELTKQF